MMNNLLWCARFSSVSGLLVILLSIGCPSNARGNVYATSIRVNDSRQDVSSPQGTAVRISYILNEAASAGAEVQILSGTNVLRSIKIPAGQPGALWGRNTVSWNGKDDLGILVPVGVYSLRIRAASSGFAEWTPISDDFGKTNYVYRGTGIAVNRNPASPYYGQVYVANSESGPNAGIPGAAPGEDNGLLRFNVDGSAPEEGILVTDPLWTGFGLSPWHVEVTDDDYVYVNDMATSGEIFRWTADLAPASKLQVLSSTNFPDPNDALYGPAIFGTETNRSIWVGDFSPTASLGILKYGVTADGTVASTNAGTAVVGIGNEANSLSQYPYDLSLDRAGSIYAIQYRSASGDLSPRVLRFPAYDPSTNGNTPELLADWAIGAEDDNMGRASGVALDPTGTYLAVAFKGIDGPSFDWINGCTQIFYASNGVLVTNLDLGIPVNGESSHQDTDCAWDAVGNIYFIDDYVQLWRSFSPPGPNQSTTVGLQHIEIIPGGGGSETPEIQEISYANGLVTIHFKAALGTPISDITLLGAPQANGSYLAVAGAVITASSTPGDYIATAPASQPALFYKIQVGEVNPNPGTPPQIQSIMFQGQMVVITFTAPAGTPTSAFKVFGAATANGPYAEIGGASVINGAGAGQYQATIPASGAIAFYRILAGYGGGTSGDAPIIRNLSYDGTTVRIDFSGAASDVPGDFVLLSTSSLSETFSPVAGATITIGTSPGEFRATAAANGSIQFYKVRK
jgi:hypothetical protein